MKLSAADLIGGVVVLASIAVAMVLLHMVSP